MNTYGKFFRVTTWGESHGKAIGCVVDGCPSNLEISVKEIQDELNRRRPGQSPITTQRKEEDKVEILSGIYDGKTIGTPISMIIYNRDVDTKPYKELEYIPRPGHGDYTYFMKYGNWKAVDASGGRGTAMIVASGAIAKKLLKKYKIEVLAYTVRIDGIESEISYYRGLDLSKIEEYRKNIESNPVRCIDRKKAKQMESAVLDAKSQGDSVGGIVEVVVTNLPKLNRNELEKELCGGLTSIPAVKAVEFEHGFSYAEMKGSEINEIQENDLVARVAVKPTSSISKPQKTVNLKTMKETTIEIKGRHDPCIVLRAVPVVEATVALTLVDRMLSDGYVPRKL